MRNCLLILATVTITASMTSCALHPARDSLATPVATRSRLITGEEISRRYHDGNLLNALQGLRGRFLVPRGPDGTSRSRPVAVYVDGLPQPLSLADLASIRTNAVSEVRYLSPIEATTRFGTGHMSGAILVILSGGTRR